MSLSLCLPSFLWHTCSGTFTACWMGHITTFEMFGWNRLENISGRIRIESGSLENPLPVLNSMINLFSFCFLYELFILNISSTSAPMFLELLFYLFLGGELPEFPGNFWKTYWKKTTSPSHQLPKSTSCKYPQPHLSRGPRPSVLRRRVLSATCGTNIKAKHSVPIPAAPMRNPSIRIDDFHRLRDGWDKQNILIEGLTLWSPISFFFVEGGERWIFLKTKLNQNKSFEKKHWNSVVLVQKMWSNIPFLIWENWNILTLWTGTGLHTKLAATWVPWRFGCSTGATDWPCWGVDWHRRKLDQKSSYHSWWHMQKAWWEFLEDSLLRNWSLLKQSFFAILSFWHPVVWAK